MSIFIKEKNDSNDSNDLKDLFIKLNIPIEDNIYKYSLENQKHIYDYLSNMNEIEKKAYLIAINHLGSSFNILRSTGFSAFKK
jgi:hypothetical protein